MINVAGIIIYIILSLSILASVYINDKQREIIERQQELLDKVLQELREQQK